MNNSLGGSYFPKTDVVVLFSSAFGCGLDYRGTITTIRSVVHCSLGIRL